MLTRGAPTGRSRSVCPDAISLCPGAFSLCSGAFSLCPGAFSFCSDACSLCFGACSLCFGAFSLCPGALPLRSGISRLILHPFKPAFSFMSALLSMSAFSTFPLFSWHFVLFPSPAFPSRSAFFFMQIFSLIPVICPSCSLRPALPSRSACWDKKACLCRPYSPRHSQWYRRHRPWPSKKAATLFFRPEGSIRSNSALNWLRPASSTISS